MFNALSLFGSGLVYRAGHMRFQNLKWWLGFRNTNATLLTDFRSAMVCNLNVHYFQTGHSSETFFLRQRQELFFAYVTKADPPNSLFGVGTRYYFARVKIEFYLVAIGPVVLVLGPRRHYGAPLLCAKLCDGPVQHVDLKDVHKLTKGNSSRVFVPVWDCLKKCHQQDVDVGSKELISQILADVCSAIQGLLYPSLSASPSLLTWLKKSTVLTATHSLMSSPSGSITASRRFPDPRVAAACLHEKTSQKWLMLQRG